MKVLFASKNAAKIDYYSSKLKEKGIDVVSLEELNITADVEETGDNAKENAIIKAEFYHKLSGLITIAIDDTLVLNNIPDHLQPKTHVRRVNNKRLNDKEMIEHYKNLAATYGENGVLKGYYLKSAAITTNIKTYTYDFYDEVCFLKESSPLIHEGYPLDSLHFIPKLNKYVSELTSEELEVTLGQNKIGLLEYISKIISEIKEGD